MFSDPEVWLVFSTIASFLFRRNCSKLWKNIKLCSPISLPRSKTTSMPLFISGGAPSSLPVLTCIFNVWDESLSLRPEWNQRLKSYNNKFLTYGRLCIYRCHTQTDHSLKDNYCWKINRLYWSNLEDRTSFYCNTNKLK